MPPSRRPRIVVADDDTDILAMVAIALRSDGCEVVEVTSGAELLEEVSASMLFGETTPPDLIISDVRMPGFSGLSVFAGLRDSGWLTPLIAMTAFSNEHSSEDIRRAGADAVFYKPFCVEELLSTVRALCCFEATGPDLGPGRPNDA
jgi:DNA-binding response OmpR family regulator